MKLIIGIDDGIILDAKRCVLVDDDALGEADRALLDNGTEAEALAVANRIGKSLHAILAGCGYGDLHYGNAIAYSPVSIRDELSARVEEISEIDEEVGKIMAWGLSLTDNDLDMIGSSILTEEIPEVWGHYFENIVMALDYWHDQTITESETK